MPWSIIRSKLGLLVASIYICVYIERTAADVLGTSHYLYLPPACPRFEHLIGVKCGTNKKCFSYLFLNVFIQRKVALQVPQVLSTVLLCLEEI